MPVCAWTSPFYAQITLRRQLANLRSLVLRRCFACLQSLRSQRGVGSEGSESCPTGRQRRGLRVQWLWRCDQIYAGQNQPRPFRPRAGFAHLGRSRATGDFKGFPLMTNDVFVSFCSGGGGWRETARPAKELRWARTMAFGHAPRFCCAKSARPPAASVAQVGT